MSDTRKPMDILEDIALYLRHINDNLLTLNGYVVTQMQDRVREADQRKADEQLNGSVRGGLDQLCRHIAALVECHYGTEASLPKIALELENLADAVYDLKPGADA